MLAAELVAVSKWFGRVLALDRVTLAISSGEVVGIAGPSGAGKTTILRLLAGLLRPSTGDVRRSGRRAIRGVRYFGGSQTLPPDVSARAWCRLCNGDGWIPEFPQSQFGLLSRGTRQRIGLESVLRARDAGLILLDEPWDGLDRDASRWLSNALAEKRAMGAAVAVCSHRIRDLAAVCDRCEFLVGGRLEAHRTDLDQGHGLLTPAERA